MTHSCAEPSCKVPACMGLGSARPTHQGDVRPSREELAAKARAQERRDKVTGCLFIGALIFAAIGALELLAAFFIFILSLAWNAGGAVFS